MYFFTGFLKYRLNTHWYNRKAKSTLDSQHFFQNCLLTCLMGKRRLLILAWLFLYAAASFAQEATTQNAKLLYWNTRVTDSGKYVTYYYRSSCKVLISNTVFLGAETMAPKTVSSTPAPVSFVPGKKKFLTAHGNISYEYFYRSNEINTIDPGRLQQHTEKVLLDLMLKEKYPFRVAFTARQSNSPFFRNFFDPNLQFDPSLYKKDIQKEIINKLDKQLPQVPELKALDAALKEEKARYNRLKNKLAGGSATQKIIEEREKIYLKQYDSLHFQTRGLAGAGKIETGIKDSLFLKGRNVKDSLDAIRKNILAKKDSIAGRIEQTATQMQNKKDSLFMQVKSMGDSMKENYAGNYKKEKKKLDSLQAGIDSMQKKYDSIKVSVQKKLLLQKQRLYKAGNRKEMEKIAAENGIAIDSSGKFAKAISSIRQFNIGRTMLNYTELTAQNINITGINAEYNPSWYGAVAAGKIDYRFRDFLNQKKVHNTQYIVMGRLGVGIINRHAVIFSVFKGRKDQSGYFLPDSVQQHINVLGYALEAIWKKDEYTYFSAEAAKTTLPYVRVDHSAKTNNVLWKFDDMSNFGMNLKAGFLIDRTNTKLSGFFRKTGENFQSFSLFSYNTNQSAWQARVDQSFLKKRLSLTAMLRQNDFTNPFTDKTFKTTTTFKTLILNVRFPKYPSVSIGYYPGTQLYIINRETIRENAYYILNAALTHAYKLHKTAMSTSVILNRYYNKATDSGFVLNKGVSWYVTHSLFLNRLQLQGGYTYNKQPELKYYTLESSVDYDAGRIIKIGAGIKCNKVWSGDYYWGEHVQLAVSVKPLGILQLQYDKSYLPTGNRSLFPVETGRITWIKIF